MREAKFFVACNAVYQGRLAIPDEVQEGKELDYIRQNLDKVSVDNLEWTSDLDPEEAVTHSDIQYISDRYEDIEPDL